MLNVCAKAPCSPQKATAGSQSLKKFGRQCASQRNPAASSCDATAGTCWCGMWCGLLDLFCCMGVGMVRAGAVLVCGMSGFSVPYKVYYLEHHY